MNQKGFANVLIIIGALVILAGALGYFVLVKNQEQVAQQTTTSPPTATQTTSTSALESKNVLLKPNSLYFGTYKATDTIFITGDNPTSFTKGEFITSSGETGTLGFNELSHSQKIYTHTGRLGTTIPGVTSFKRSSKGDILYVAINYFVHTNRVNKVLGINLTNGEVVEIWSYQLGSGKYKGRNGSAIITSLINDQFLILQLASCDSCGGGDGSRVLILNLVTKLEKFYTQEIGDLRFDLAHGLFSYRLLAENCPPEFDRCAPTPTGEQITDRLP